MRVSGCVPDVTGLWRSHGLMYAMSQEGPSHYVSPSPACASTRVPSPANCKAGLSGRFSSGQPLWAPSTAVKPRSSLNCWHAAPSLCEDGSASPVAACGAFMAGLWASGCFDTAAC